MNFKLSISVLVSCAYFLTLFIVNVLKTNNILGTLFSASIYAVILFLILYILLQYIEFAFEGLKKKESQEALDKIAKIENEFKKKQKQELDDRLKEIRKEEKPLYYDYEESDENEGNDKVEENDGIIIEKDTTEDDIKKLKRDSGTQFDSRFIEQGGPNI